MIPEIVFPLFLVLLLVSFRLKRRIDERLEDIHPDKHQAMGGRPTYGSGPTTGQWMATSRFFLSREYRAFKDERLSRLADLYLVVSALQLLVFLAMMYLAATQTPAS